MPKQKEMIYLTDITLHTRESRQTLNFSKVAQKGRMYSPISSGNLKNLNSGSDSNKLGEFSLEINLPQDLQERLNRGEAELMMPKGGLLVYAGRDAWEKAKEAENAKRRLLIHRSRTWHADQKE